MSSRLTLLLAAVLLLAGCGGSPSEQAATPTQPASKFAGGELMPPRKAPPLALRDVDGSAPTLAGQRGKLVLVTFLYTNCPDVCPLIAQNLNAALRALSPAQRRDVRVLAVSVDPKGDTAAAVRAYEQKLELLPEFHYLIGTRPQLKRVWTAWNVLAVQSSPDVVDHVAYTALIDRDGKQRVLYPTQLRARQVIHDLRLLLGAKA